MPMKAEHGSHSEFQNIIVTAFYSVRHSTPSIQKHFKM